jgi:hypothetical protein
LSPLRSAIDPPTSCPPHSPGRDSITFSLPRVAVLEHFPLKI